MGNFQVLNCANDTKSCNALHMSHIQKTQRLPEEKQDKLPIKLVMDTIFSHRRRLLNTELVKGKPQPTLCYEEEIKFNFCHVL